MEIEDLVELFTDITDNDPEVEQVDGLVLVVKEAKVKLAELTKPYTDIQNKAKAKIEQIIRRTGRTNWNSDLQNGHAYIPASSIRITYDVDILDRYLESCDDPTVRAILLLARKETQVKSSLVIK